MIRSFLGPSAQIAWLVQDARHADVARRQLGDVVGGKGAFWTRL